MFSDEQKTLLSGDLSQADIASRSQNGMTLSYIEGWRIIQRANEIFGFDGWSYRLIGVTEQHKALGKDRKGNEQWQAAYIAQVLVRVGDVEREDIGFGSGFGRQAGDAIEGATKEAVTDALKRALRTFGNQFGNALYDKAKENVEGTPANIAKLTKAKARALFSELQEDIAQIVSDEGSDAEALTAWGRQRSDDINSMPDDWVTEIQQQFRDALGNLRGRVAA